MSFRLLFSLKLHEIVFQIFQYLVYYKMHTPQIYPIFTLAIKFVDV